MVDQGSAAEIMYPDLYKGLNLKAEDLMPYSSPLVSFEGKIIIPKGQVRLPVQTGSEVVDVDFIVVDAYSPYTAIVARPWLHTLGVVSSTLHQKVKYPSNGQIKERLRDQAVARQCMGAALQHKPEAESSVRGEKGFQQLKSSALSIDKPTEDAKCEDLVKVVIGDDPEKFFQIGSQLPHQEREELIEFLRKNIDVFAWNAYEALEVDLEFICHHLKVNSLSRPWQFAQWGYDIVGPFPKVVGNKKYLLVGTDYFTKQVEVKPLANIRDVDVKRFVWKNIATRFGVPHVLF